MPRSQNYYWRSNALLGSGAVGEVYSGHNITTGEVVAVKVMKNFKASQLQHLLELQERELEVLRKLDHPNIVKLKDVEAENPTDLENKRKIIVMELCTGGSLYNLLSSPVNAFGLDDKEFLNVLNGIASGMKKLHSENIVHRDIKPGNIMRFIGNDGRTTYKLIDFGAARELHAEQQFESIYGTEEYLHPTMYEKAFMRGDGEQLFRGSVDLWSIGATLYHVATGQIPFESLEGRKDKRTMFEIIAGKKSGDISGRQDSRTRKIVYSQQLPNMCYMSEGLRPFVENLLARLLETDDAKTMPFEEFFEVAENIVRKRVVSVFDCNTTDLLKIYMDPTCNFQGFQDLLGKQCKVDPSNQLLLHENLDFVEQFGSDKSVMTCGEVVDTNPVYLYYKCPAGGISIGLDDAKYSIPLRSNIKGPKADLQFAGYCSESMHCIRRNISKCLLRQKLIMNAANMLIRFLGRKFDKFTMRLEHFSDVIQLHRQQLQSSELLAKVLYLANRHEEAQKAHASLGRQKSLHLKMEMEVAKLHEHSSKLERGLQRAVDMWVGEKPSCKEEDCCLPRMDVVIKSLDATDEFSGSRKELEQAKLKCQELENQCRMAKELIENHCQVNAKKLVEYFANFLREIWSQKENLADVEKNIKNQFQRQELLSDSLSEAYKRTNDLLHLPALNFDPKVSSGGGDGEERKMSVEEGRLVLGGSVKRRESVEKKYAGQLYSLRVSTNNSFLSSQLNPLVEENNRIIEGLMSQIVKAIPASATTDTFQGKSDPSREDKTLT